MSAFCACRPDQATAAPLSKATLAQALPVIFPVSLDEDGMAAPATTVQAVERTGRRDVGFAIGIVFILTVLFLPLPPTILDIGLAFSIAFSVLILMVALWIQRPLDFSAFPTILLVATILRLALNVATTRLILSEGS